MDHSHMDHSHMDHSHMDHGGHGGGGGGSGMCSMNMLFTWDTTDLCVVFRSWRVTGAFSLLWTFVAVVALTAGYEAVREASRRYEARHSVVLQNMPLDNDAERSSLLWAPGNATQAERSRGKLVLALLYGLQVFYSFFIMLLFMTYNGWIMIAVGIGAAIGYLLFSGASATKTAACH